MKTINHECYVSLEVAKLLKEAGFNWKCKGVYNEGKLHIWYEPKSNDWWKCQSDIYAAPTLDVAQRWLREVKDTYVIPQISDYEVDGHIWEYDYRVGIHNINPIRSLYKYKSYEEAQEAGIKKALELILEKGGQHDS